MASLPAEGRWSIRRVADDDLNAALQFLRRDPLINVYLISRLLEEPAAAASQMVIVRMNGSIVLVASLASNIVLGSEPALAPDIVETAIDLVADRILVRMLPVRAIISPAHLVELLWNRLRTRIDAPTVVRMNQPIYALSSGAGLPDLDRARYSSIRDLDALVPACAAMHREEVGIDPLERDAVGYRERIRELVLKKRSIVLVENGTIVSKCEYSAVTDESVQLMGVWTHPQHRRHGYSRITLRETCGHLLRERKTVTLFVNDFNTPAIRLYEEIGFHRIGLNRALIW